MGIPFAPRKSLAGFIAACITGAAVAAGFWTFNAPMRPFPGDITWTWANGVQALADSPIPAEYTFSLTGAIGLTAISLFAGLVSGVAEALG
jgi:diacylglycerol kinase (CTP)